jgi:hypothetical protein
MSFFDEVLSDPKGLEEKLLGPSYNYTDNIIQFKSLYRNRRILFRKNSKKYS